jgi:hypothetical protein
MAAFTGQAALNKTAQITMIGIIYADTFGPLSLQAVFLLESIHSACFD